MTIILISTEIIGSPLKFPESDSHGRSLERKPIEDSESRFFLHKKRKTHKFGCGQGNFHNRFRRQSEVRFFFPILNYYDTDIIVSNGYTGTGSDCGSTGENGKPTLLGSGGKPQLIGLGGKPPLGGLVSNLGSGLGSGLGNIGSGLGSFGHDLTSSLGSLLPSIGNGIPPLGSGFGSQNVRPPAPVVTRPPDVRPPAPVYTRPPAPVYTRPPAPVYTRPPVTRPPVVSPPHTTTDSGDDGDSEDYDYTDFSTTVRARPLSGPTFTGHRPMPITNPLVNNNFQPVFESPERHFNRYIVRPINRTIREFYSLF